MANVAEQQRAAIGACVNIQRAKTCGLKDTDVVAATFALLVAAIKTRRDAVTTSPANRPTFDALITSLATLNLYKILTDSACNLLATVSAVPFVAAVNTDLMSVAATNHPSSDPTVITSGSYAHFDSFQNV